MEGRELTRGLSRSCPKPLPPAPGQGNSETIDDALISALLAKLSAATSVSA